MPLLCPLFLPTNKVRIVPRYRPYMDGRLLCHNGRVGVVKSVRGPLVPCYVREGAFPGLDWSWFLVTLELDGGMILRDVPEGDLVLVEL